MYSISIKWWLSKGLLPIAFLFFFLLLKLPATSQLIQTNRYEQVLNLFDPGFDVVPADDKGIFLYRRLTTQLNDALEVCFLDTAFKKKWEGFLPVEKGFVITRHRFFNDALFFILRYHDFSKNDMQIIKLNYKEQTFIQYNIHNFIPFNPTEFHITKRAAIFGGYFNKTPVVVYFEFITQQFKVLPGLFNEPGELTQVKTYPDDSFDILVSAKNFSNKKTIWVRNYDSGGNIVKNTMLEPEGDNHLLFGRSIRTTDGKQIVSGVYSTNSKEFSKGIFIANIGYSGDQHVQYYNYADLENFFKYMRANQEKRVKNRIERRKIKGRKLRFNYRLIVHDLVSYKGQYVMLGEAFYPKYIYPDSYSGFSRSSLSYGRLPIIQNGRIFDGYYYTHAVVIGFDEQGRLQWDNSFEINDVKTFELEQFVKLEAEDDKITLIYLFENELRSKLIKDNEVLEGKTSEPLKLSAADDYIKKKDYDNSKLEYWHKGAFIAYGTQLINNKKYPGAKRKVFFMNKIVR